MDIINIFQAICKKYINNTEDAGCGMRNLEVGGYIVQVYPNDEYHNVWFLRYDDTCVVEDSIKDYPVEKQLKWLEQYYKTITMGKIINQQALVVIYDKEAKLSSLYTENGVVKYFDTLYDAECKRDEIMRQNANIKVSVTTFCIL